MKYRWYYIEVFRDAKERFEKQKTAGAEIPQQSLLEGAFEYLDQRHSLGEEEQYDQDQTWRHRMESGCGDSDLCTDLYWVLTFCSMMSDLGVYLDGMVQGNAEGFKRGLNKVMEPFDGRLSYGEQAAYRLDVICYVVMTMNDHMDRSEEACQRIADILGKLWIALVQQIEENGKIARISRYVENNQECLRDSTLLTERVLAQDNGPDCVGVVPVRSRKCRSKPLTIQKLTIQMKQMKIMMTIQMTRTAGGSIVQWWIRAAVGNPMALAKKSQESELPWC